MTIPKSSTGIYHVVLGAINEGGVFRKRNDYKKFMEIVKMYKESLGIRLLGYSLTPLVVHLVVRDNRNKVMEFLDLVIETYTAYCSKEHFMKDVFHSQKKIKAIENYKTFKNTFKYIHKFGENSLKRFQIYDFDKKDEFLDGDYVLSAFGVDNEQSKNEMNNISVMEASENYKFRMNEMEYFAEEKKTMRIRRAEKFMKSFLEENNIKITDLKDDDYYNDKLRLIRAFRKETDLSYRDIGEILGMSHTSIIRLWKIAHERDIAINLS
ncbi:MAG: hypothetical protein U9Q80_03140 [Bacillota bacterium]|nr:hypothetical protein [Bacillota bacterium]